LQRHAGFYIAYQVSYQLPTVEKIGYSRKLNNVLKIVKNEYNADHIKSDGGQGVVLARLRVT
jgi:hypothetical protein